MLRKLFVNMLPVPGTTSLLHRHSPSLNRHFSNLKIAEKSLSEIFESPQQQTIFDLSFREGERSRLLLEHGHRVLGLEDDSLYFDNLEQTESENTNFVGVRGRLEELAELLEEHNLREWAESCSAVIVEFGPGRAHFKKGRGLDPAINQPLDLRMGDEGTPAWQLLDHLDQTALTSILSRYASVVCAKEISICLLEQRYLNKKVRTTHDLRRLVVNSIGHLDHFRGPDGHQLVQQNLEKVFLALRLFVNNELNRMKYTCRLAKALLPPGGKLITSVQTEKEEKHLRNFIFSDPDTSDKCRDWTLDKRLELEDNTVMLHVTRQMTTQNENSS